MSLSNAEAPMTISGTAAPYGLGWMSGTTAEAGAVRRWHRQRCVGRAGGRLHGRRHDGTEAQQRSIWRCRLRRAGGSRLGVHAAMTTAGEMLLALSGLASGQAQDLLAASTSGGGQQTIVMSQAVVLVQADSSTVVQYPANNAVFHTGNESVASEQEGKHLADQRTDDEETSVFRTDKATFALRTSGAAFVMSSEQQVFVLREAA